MNRLLVLWESLGTSPGIAALITRYCVYITLLFFAYACITVQLNWSDQLLLGILTVGLAYLMHRMSGSEMITMALMYASMLATARYAYWRISTLVDTLRTQGLEIGVVNIFLMLLLLSAEVYAFVILYLGFLQTIRPLRRPPVPLPGDVNSWPHVDVLIPTYNEPLAVVRSTVFAALNMDYPQEKLHVYLLDDGKREEFRLFCGAVGSGYITRTDNAHAKAGNINHALTLIHSPLVAIFDCDHVPTRSFLQTTLGWFNRDEKLGMLQTPHYFYSLDPFERNLKQFTAIPNEGELFYGLIQDGNDLWNATFFCGSCAVARRTALDEIRGIATETVTEDAHTSLRMQSKGWNSAYINIPQAGGLATESLSGHVGQRIRWARGMVQIFRIDNPLFAPGLRWHQRLCYLNTMLHFFYAMPRLIFLTAPLIYMLLGMKNIPGFWVAIVAYSMPHLYLANLTNFRTQALYRYSFWNEVYETVLAPYILAPTVLALLNPRLGKFNVTAKGGLVKHSYFDNKIAWPYIVLIFLNVAGLVMVPIRLLYLNPGHPGTIAMNAFWILFNLVILGTATAVAHEPRQLRAEVRIGMRRPVEVRLEDGKAVSGETSNMSLGGVLLKIESDTKIAPGSKVHVVYLHRGTERVFAAVVVNVKGNELRAAYEPLSIQQEEQMTLLLYTDADMWLSRSENRKPDKPVLNLWHLVRLSVVGVKYAIFGWMFRSKRTRAIGVQATMLILALGLACQVSSAQTQHKEPPLTSSTPTAAGGKADLPPDGFRTTMSLGDMGAPNAIIFRGVMASRDIPFSIPQNVVAEHAKLNLKYGFSTGLIAQLSHLSVFLNGVLIATLPVPQNTGQLQAALEQEVPLPAELLVRNNVLGLQFVGHYTTRCDDPSNTVLWAQVASSSAIELSGSLLALVNDLKRLPLPFYDGAVSSIQATIPVAFLRPPSKQALEAAGIVASWFGVVARSRPLVFPVSIGSTLPKGNLILFVESLSDIPPSLGVTAYGPVVAVRTNPSDEHGKVLVIAGDSGEHIVTAARAVALGSPMLEGQTAYVNRMELPPPREVNDAPLWIPVDEVSPIVQYAGSPQAQSDGSGPLPFYLRAPPDLYFGSKQNVPMRLDYRYNAISLANASTLRVELNGAMVTDVPLPHENDAGKTLSRNVDIPVLSMRPFSNTLQFNFYFQIAKTGTCEDAAPINLKGAILPSSYLDLRGLSHWATMPDLELFANAGFPFTRFADLSQSVIVLPSSASARDIELYLTLIAYMGEQTGYPALRLSVGDEKDLGKDLDYLIIGTQGAQPGFEQLKSKLPVLIQEKGLTVRETGGFFQSIQERIYEETGYRPHWWRLTPKGERPGLIEALEEVPDAVIQGVESPWGKSRSVVTITLRDKDVTQNFAEAFWKSSMSDDISKQVSVLHGTTFSSFRLQRTYYHVGHLSPLEWMRFWLRGTPWVIALFTLLLGVLIVPWTKARLDRRARDRIEARDL